MLETKFPNLNKIDPKIQISFLNQFLAVAIQFHQRVSSVFLPTAIKFHYLFNLRDLSNIVQVLENEERNSLI
jgi:dynein heavy chain